MHREVVRKSSQEILAEMKAGDDGKIAKPIGIWSLEKLASLHLYFNAFTKACRSVGGGHYIDGFAGPGVCRLRNAQPLPYSARGSPLLALNAKPNFERCWFVELDPANASALRARTRDFDARAAVRERDANSEVPRILRQDVPPRAPAFCLFDQQGTELAWSTVEAVAATPARIRKPELMILFPLRMSLLRLLTTRKRISQANASRITSAFPSQDWMWVYEERVAERISATDAQERYLSLYADGIRSLGYRWVRTKAITAPRAPGLRRQEMYHLIFATDNEAGDRIMGDVFRRPYVLDFPVTGRLPLFDV